MEGAQNRVEAEVFQVVTQQAGLAKNNPPAAKGLSLFVGTRFNCVKCHQFSRSDSPAATLKGLYGQEIVLANGKTWMVDEAYIRQAIIDPEKHSYDGFEPEPMPIGYERSFVAIQNSKFAPNAERDILTELVELIKTLEQ